MKGYKPTATYKLIYVYTIHDEQHEGKLKIGKAELSSLKSASQLVPNCDELVTAAKKRIDQQTKTAMVDYDLLYTELAIRHLTMEDGSVQIDLFEDHDIHDVLKNSGHFPLLFRESGKDSEWYTISLDIAKKAISTYKAGKCVIHCDTENEKAFQTITPSIVLRDEQERNIKKTISVFKTENKMLWDCKMRYGKTVTAFELMRQMGSKKVIVITHRPAVEDSWDTDHDLIFKGTNHRFIDKTKESIDGYDAIIDSKNDQILYEMVQNDIPFTYFASIQDLRHSKRVGGPYNKNNAVFDLEWDLLIIDEAHEGVQTEHGEAVIKALIKPKTKVLSLTGTAYSIRKDYGDNVFTWTYVDEQKAKQMWEELHPFEKNPYADLPTMNILTFDLGDKIDSSYRYVTEDMAFNFREFFRTWTGDIKRDYRPIPEGKNIGDFVHEDAVWSFLNLISTKDESTNYPFSTEEYVDMFRHTFWLVPGVKEAKALSKLLKSHPVFCDYGVVNVAGDGDEEEQYDIALKKVKNAIKTNEKTITISCGRLTTGVTVREWTAIMMLSGSTKTSVNGYMQAIFRVQSPGVINGKQKENCYVFDFAPDRALSVIGEAHKQANKTGQGGTDRIGLGEFLNFCPVISVEGTEMHVYDVPEMMRQIKRISVDSAINSGFDDNTIYLSDAGLTRTDLDLEILRKLSDVVAPKKKSSGAKHVEISGNGLTKEQRRKLGIIKKKPKKELTEEERELLEIERKEKQEQQKLFDLLRAISIRLPLLFYGADVDISQVIHLKDFVELVDDESWEEFMPKNLKKELFLAISKYYDEDVLVGAGLRIRKLAKAADEYPPTIRASKIVEIISKFKNPDKETVLTPWRVVNMHMGDTLGGYNFYDEQYGKELEEPRLIENDEVTADILLNPDVKILEMNSKSGLYPLYVAYSIYKFKVQGKEIDNSQEELQRIWDETIQNNIFVLCKTKMARSITIRTLVGYSKKPTNVVCLTKLYERMSDLGRFRNILTNAKTWNKEGDRLKFEAIIGNPPYQETGGSGGTSDSPIFQIFAEAALKLNPKYTSLIMPARWYAGGRENLIGAFREMMLNNKSVKKLITYDDSHDVFPSVEIKGGLCVYLTDTSYSGDCEYTLITDGKRETAVRDLSEFDILIKYPTLAKIVKKVMEVNKDNPTVDSLISNDTPFGISTNPKESKKNPIKVYPKSDESHSTKLFYIDKSKRTVEYISKDIISKNADAIEKEKVFIPSGYGAGEKFPHQIIGVPEYAGANSVCSQSFLYAAFASSEEAKNFISYLSTKFFRALVLAMKITQSAPTKVYRFVPIQDFTSQSNICWQAPITEIDKQLYTIYGLTPDEIDFIEEKIKVMES